MKIKYLTSIIWVACLLFSMTLCYACNDDDTPKDDSEQPTEENPDGKTEGGYLDDVDLSGIDVSNKTLKEVCEGKFLFGAAVQYSHIIDNPEGSRLGEQALLKKHFNAVVAEGDMKWKVIHPEKEVYDWEKADALVDFAEKNNMAVTGHCLIWHTALPDWVWKKAGGGNVTPEELKQNMKTHITTVMQRYKGRIKGWDVVNEAFNSDGTYRDTPFYQILGKEYIIWAFQCAKEADPDCELYYNDFELYHTPKRQAVLRLIGELRDNGVELDAVGLQAHMWRTTPALDVYENLIRTFRDAGVKVMITEWDMSFVNKDNDLYPNGLPKDVEAEWDQRVFKFFKLFLKYKDAITRVTTWGISDSHSWRNDGCTDYPLLFDRQQEPKGAVELMMKAAIADTQLTNQKPNE